MEIVIMLIYNNKTSSPKLSLGYKVTCPLYVCTETKFV